MRWLIRRSDAWLSRLERVYVFCEDADCKLRLQVAGTPHMLHLTSRLIPKGQPVLMLHLWNERIPAIPPNGPDLPWAVKTSRHFSRSLHQVGRYVQNAPWLRDIQAVGGISALIILTNSDGGARILCKLGFEVFPYQNPLGRFGEFWENFYSWWLMWAYNPASLHRRNFFRQQRTEIWMTMDEFLKRYG